MFKIFKFSKVLQIYLIILLLLNYKSIITYNEELYLFNGYNFLFILLLYLISKDIKKIIVFYNYYKSIYLEKLYFLLFINLKKYIYNNLIIIYEYYKFIIFCYINKSISINKIWKNLIKFIYFIEEYNIYWSSINENFLLLKELKNQ